MLVWEKASVPVQSSYKHIEEILSGSLTGDNQRVVQKSPLGDAGKRDGDGNKLFLKCGDGFSEQPRLLALLPGQARLRSTAFHQIIALS
jgi:hypothetical protein